MIYYLRKKSSISPVSKLLRALIAVLQLHYYLEARRRLLHPKYATEQNQHPLHPLQKGSLAGGGPHICPHMPPYALMYSSIAPRQHLIPSSFLFRPHLNFPLALVTLTKGQDQECMHWSSSSPLPARPSVLPPAFALEMLEPNLSLSDNFSELCQILIISSWQMHCTFYLVHITGYVNFSFFQSKYSLRDRVTEYHSIMTYRWPKNGQRWPNS